MNITTFAFGLALSALPVSASAAQEQQKGAATGDMKPITVVGCLQAGAQPNQFVLATTADPMAKGVAVAVSGAVPNVTYVLSGGTNLAAHVGHRVQITGSTTGKARKAESTDRSVKRAEAPGPDTKVETREKATIEMRDLQIESLKMVSTSCAAPK